MMWLYAGDFQDFKGIAPAFFVTIVSEMLCGQRYDHTVKKGIRKRSPVAEEIPVLPG